MSTFLLSGFKRKDIFVQHVKDEIGYVVDAADPRAAVEAAKKNVGSMVAFLDCVEIADAPDELKRRLKPLALLEANITRKIDGTEFMIR
jgi:hypothetical protein